MNMVGLHGLDHQELNQRIYLLDHILTLLLDYLLKELTKILNNQETEYL